MSFLVYLLSTVTLPSFSDSYYTEARDVVVGLLLVVSAFLARPIFQLGAVGKGAKDG